MILWLGLPVRPLASIEYHAYAYFVTCNFFDENR